MPDSGPPVSRLPFVSDATPDPMVQEQFARIRAQRPRILNIHRVTAHAPKLAQAQGTYATALREQSSLPRNFQELIILRVAQINNSLYEQSVHRPIALACGASAEQIARLPAWQEAEVFSPRERTALAYVEQAARSGAVDDATFAALQAEFTAREIVELTALIAWYVGNSRFVRALGIAPEPE
jgi:4-carboxymuconolactone decarboxylase